jgi:serine/threonine-protein kinase
MDRELGRGGMGLVFLGRDLQLDRPVVIKTILPEWFESQGSATMARSNASFTEEARLSANLIHEGIARIFDHGTHENKLFTVMEYLGGESLRELLWRRKRLSLEEVRRIIAQVAEALDYAHSRYVVHRDLKPENIREREPGRFVVLDFGLARQFSKVEFSGFWGTPAYASPEQSAALPVDGRSDQYSLALIAYELLTGKRVFESSSALALIHMHIHIEPPPPWLSLGSAEIPLRIWMVILRALEKKMDDRYETCSEFAEALG